MNKAFVGYQGPERPAEDLAILNVVVVYEDTSCGVRAVRTLNRLPDGLRADLRLTRRLWRWDLLEDPLLNDRAAEEAGNADVILLAGHGQAELPFQIKAWLIEWLVHRPDHPCAFGVLLDRQQASFAGANPVLSYVQQIADAAQVDFFYGFSEPTVFEHSEAASTTLFESAAL